MNRNLKPTFDSDNHCQSPTYSTTTTPLIDLPKLYKIDAIQVMMGGVSRATVYRRINKGLFIPPVKIGVSSFWKEEDILAWHDSLTQEVSANA